MYVHDNKCLLNSEYLLHILQSSGHAKLSQKPCKVSIITIRMLKIREQVWVG